MPCLLVYTSLNVLSVPLAKFAEATLSSSTRNVLCEELVILLGQSVLSQSILSLLVLLQLTKTFSKPVFFCFVFFGGEKEKKIGEKADFSRLLSAIFFPTCILVGGVLVF